MELTFDALSKNYGKKQALIGFSAELTGGIYGLLGPNGAGKSTLMNILTGNLRQTAGEIRFNGAEIRSLGAAFRGRVGYMPQQQTLYPGFTAERFLLYMASLRRMPRARALERIDWALGAVGLSDVRGKTIRSLSGGNQQKVILGRWLLTDPDVLLLDEPTRGIDVGAKSEIHKLMTKFAREGMGIIMISSELPEVLGMSDRVVVMQEGIIQGTLDRSEATQESIMKLATRGVGKQ